VKVPVPVLGPSLILTEDEHGVLECLLDRPLILDLVDEVDEVDLLVALNLAVEVRSERISLLSKKASHAQAISWETGNGAITRSEPAAHRRWEVHYEQVGRVAEVVDLAPENGRAASNLDERALDAPFLAGAGAARSKLGRLFVGLGRPTRVANDDLLRFDKVGDVAEGVDPPTEVTRPRPVSRAARDEEQQQWARAWERDGPQIEGCESRLAASA
jgi:hypothetical protein